MSLHLLLPVSVYLPLPVSLPVPASLLFLSLCLSLFLMSMSCYLNYLPDYDALPVQVFLSVVVGKCNKIVLNACKKVGLVFDTLVSSAEVINCNGIEIQVRVMVLILDCNSEHDVQARRKIGLFEDY